MEEFATYIAYEASPEMHQLAEKFLDQMARNNPKPQADLLLQVMNRYIPESMDAFLLKPSDIVGLTPTTQKVVNLSASTIHKTSQSLTKHILKKTNNKDLKQLTGFIESMILREHDTDRGQPLSAVPISRALFDKITINVENIREGIPTDYCQEVVNILLEVSEQVASQVMVRPMELLPLGPIMKKMANIGLETAVAASNKVIQQVFGKLNDQQMLKAADYFDSLLVTSTKIYPQSFYDTNRQYG